MLLRHKADAHLKTDERKNITYKEKEDAEEQQRLLEESEIIMGFPLNKASPRSCQKGRDKSYKRRSEQEIFYYKRRLSCR